MPSAMLGVVGYVKPPSTNDKYAGLEQSCFMNPQDAAATAAAQQRNSLMMKPGERMANKAGEPEFQLELSPDTLTFPWAPLKRPVFGEVILKNTSKEKQSYKVTPSVSTTTMQVRCTSTEIFRVQPPMGFINPGTSMAIRIWFQNKAPLDPKVKHYFVFCHKKAIVGKTLDDIWAQNAKPDGVRRVMAQFTAEQK